NKTMKYVSCDPDIEKEFANLASDDIDSLMKVGIYKHNCPNYSINNIDAYANTPSKKHILKYATNITKEYPEGSKNSNMRGMLNKALANEEHIINEGKIPFYHGRKRQYDFVSQLFTFLYNVNNASTKNTT